MDHGVPQIQFILLLYIEILALQFFPNWTPKLELLLKCVQTLKNHHHQQVKYQFTLLDYTHSSFCSKHVDLLLFYVFLQ